MTGSRNASSRRGFFGDRVSALILVAVLCAAGFLPSPFLAVAPGPVFSLSGLVEVSGKSDPRTSFHMVTVSAQEADWFQVFWAAINPDIAVWDEQSVTGGKGIEEYEEEMGVLMEESRSRAARLAFEHAGMPATDEAIELISVEDSEVLGPSAGLAFALQLSSILREEDLAGGLAVAATGVLDDYGRVLAVGGIAQKVIACRDNGIDVFLVPAGNALEAANFAKDMRVISVESLDEAIGALKGLAGPIP